MANPITDDRPLRWGFIGAGGIADKFARDLDSSPSNVLAAVAARSGERAQAFAERHGGGRGYDDYRAVVEDPDVDVVYVATTHPYHREQALLAIEAGKPVLIEKPVCLNAKDTREVFDAAAAAGVFAMEAMWMRTNPLIRKAQKLIADGAIGQLRSVRAEMSLGLPYDPGHRLYDLANGGGALLDLGIYPITFAWIFLGKPDQLSYTGELCETGADATVAMQCRWADGCLRPALVLGADPRPVPRPAAGHRRLDPHRGPVPPTDRADRADPDRAVPGAGPAGRAAARLPAADRGGRALPAGRPVDQRAGAAGRDHRDHGSNWTRSGPASASGTPASKGENANVLHRSRHRGADRAPRATRRSAWPGWPSGCRPSSTSIPSSRSRSNGSPPGWPEPTTRTTDRRRSDSTADRLIGTPGIAINLSDSWLSGPIPTANSTVPIPTLPPSSQPTPSTVSSSTVRVSRIDNPVRRA